MHLLILIKEILKLSQKPRNMRTLPLFIIVFILIPVLSIAQKYDSELDYMQAEFGKDKRVLVEDFMALTKEEADLFWPAYDAYEKRRQEMGKERWELLKVYLNNYNTINDAEAADWMNKLFDYQAREGGLLLEYYSKMKTMLGARRGMQFYQMEIFFAIEIRTAIMEEVPFIGEK